MAAALTPQRKPMHPLARWAWWLLAWLALVMAVIGALLPVIPSVPFLLLAAFAAARGSARLHARLLAHPRLGPPIRDWQAHGAVSRRAKWLALTMMSLSGASLALFAPAWIAGLGIACMGGVGLWLWRRPEPDHPRSF